MKARQQQLRNNNKPFSPRQHNYTPRRRASTLATPGQNIESTLAYNQTFVNNVNVLGPSIITLILIMLIISYNSSQLFRIEKSNSITIAVESGIQNATVGITIGNIIMPLGTGISILSLSSGVYGILMYLVCLPLIFIFLRFK